MVQQGLEDHVDGSVLSLVKGITSGTTGLIYPGPAPTAETIRAAMDPVRGLGADLFISLGDDVRAFTAAGEISPPSAALRLAAAFLHSRAPNAESWEFLVAGVQQQVTRQAGEYVINHGAWALPGGETARNDGQDGHVTFVGLPDPRPGLRVTVGERTVTVAVVRSAAELAAIDLQSAPTVEPPAGLVAVITIMGERTVDLTDDAGRPIGSQNVGAFQLRGFDSQAGEVFSADVLAVAAAAAAHTWMGEASATEWVSVFGGGNTRVELRGEAFAAAEVDLFAEATWRP